MSKFSLIDTHCHLDFIDFDADRTRILDECTQLGINTLFIPSVAQSQWGKTIEICDLYSHCKLALGLHPVFIEQHQPHHLSELNELVTLHKPIAIGEIGLDFYIKELDKEKQIAYFTKQLLIANDHKLPLIIHNRKAHDECISVLQKYDHHGGIIHAFNGSIQQAMKYIEEGFLLGFGGMITYQRSSKLRALLEKIPIENIVLETDAPDMVVERHRGERNSPSYLIDILNSVASIKNSNLVDVANTTTDNALNTFNLI